jgi:homoserine dehydrogenase
MKDEGAAFADVLKDAQDKGYAERNPAADVEGLDAARKIVILAALAFGKSISPNDISVEGITNISTEDVELAASFGYAIKLIGHAEMIDGKILAMVSPRLIPYSNPLSGINDVFNGILLGADMVGQVMFYGPGAGKLPTASAVCADIVDVAAHVESGINLPKFEVANKNDLADFGSYSCRRMFVFNKCEKCALDKETAEKCFGPIEKITFNKDRVALITEKMTENDAKALTEKLNGCKSYRLI